MKLSLSRNAIIGLTFIASLVMLYFGVNFLKGINVFKKKNVYYALFEDVSKLYVSSPIFVKGYQIGLVNSIKMAGTEPMRFVVEMNMEDGFRIRENSRLEFGVDLFGASTVNIIMPEDGAYIEPGDTIPGAQEMGMMDGLVSMAPKADAILLRVDSMVMMLNKLMANPMWEKSIEGIGATVEELNRSGRNLNMMMGTLQRDLPTVSQNLAAVSDDLKDVTGELKQMDLQKTFASIDATVDNLKDLSSKLNATDNSIGLLMNDTKLHDSINSTINNATKLLEDIRQNPEKYLSVRVKLF